VGSSPFEARLAQTVTLVGGNGELSPSIENDLNHAGCNVKRISLEEQAEILEEDVIADKQDQIQAIINRLVNENGRREK
jgi:putative cell wall-binding protein